MSDEIKYMMETLDASHGCVHINGRHIAAVIRELEQQLAAVSAERDALAKVVERLTDGMDWAGGDAYGMPECPWCGAEPNEAQAFHAPNCTLIEARKILAAAEAAKAKEGT